MLFCFVGAGMLLLGNSPAQRTPVTQEKAEEIPVVVPLLLSSTGAVTSRLVVDLSDRQVKVYYFDELQDTYSIAVGQDGWETPTGDFQVNQLSDSPTWKQPITGEIVPAGSPENPLGDRWIGFWSDGTHQIGFHGSNQESLIGQAVSHGCVRMRNEDIKKMYDFISLGTQVIVKR